MPNVTGFWSGFQPVTPGAASVPTYTVMVNDTKPIWFYCSKANHCQTGMVGAINAPATGNKTIEAFIALAAAAGQNLAPGQSNSTAPAAGASSSSYGYGSSSTTASLSTSTVPASAPTSSGSTTTTATTAVSTGGASGSLFAGPQHVLTGFSMAALLSAVLL